MDNLQRLDECKPGDRVQRYLFAKYGTYTVCQRRGMGVEVLTQDGRRGELYAWELVKLVK